MLLEMSHPATEQHSLLSPLLMALLAALLVSVRCDVFFSTEDDGSSLMSKS